MFTINDYRSEDHESLMDFFRHVFREMGFLFDPYGKDSDLADIQHIYQLRNGIFLIAKAGEKIAGTIGMRRLTGEIFELKRFYVIPEYQGKGLGQMLLERAFAHAAGTSAKAIRLDTTYQSQTAIALFKRFGFIEIERYNNDPYAEIFMELSLERIYRNLEK